MKLFILFFAAIMLVSSARHADRCTKFSSFNSWGNEEDFVWSFPESKQAHVRRCLDKLAKKRGLV